MDDGLATSCSDLLDDKLFVRHCDGVGCAKAGDWGFVLRYHFVVDRI